MLKDIFGQAWEAMLYNRRRTAITMIGMAWGIATVVLLLAYGAGFQQRDRGDLRAVGHQHHRRVSGAHQRAGRRREVGRQGAVHHGRCGSADRQRSGHQSHFARRSTKT